MFEYYFSKGFTYFDCTIINLTKLPPEVKEIIDAEVTDNSEKVMVCSTTVTSTSNTPKNLLLNKSFRSSYIQNEFDDRKEYIIYIFSVYVEPLIKEINHPSLLQEWKLNIDAAEYVRNIYANLYKASEKNKFNCIDSDDYCPTSLKDKIQWFPFLIIMEHTANITEKQWADIIIIKVI